MAINAGGVFWEVLFQLDDASLENMKRDVKAAVQEAERALGSLKSTGAEQAFDKTAQAARRTRKEITPLQAEIKGLRNESLSLRGAYEAGFISQQELTEGMTRLLNRTRELTTGLDAQSKELLDLNTVAARASRTIDASAGRVNKLGLSAGVAAGTTQSLTNQFSAMGNSLSMVIGVAGIGGLVRLTDSLARSQFDAEMAIRLFNRELEKSNALAGDGQQAISTLAERFGLFDDQVAGAATILLRAGASLEQIDTLLTAGGASALSFGRSVESGFDNVAQAVSSGNSALLQSIGISGNLSKYNKELAQSLGKTVEELTEQERITAAVNLVTAETGSEVEALSDVLGGYAGAQNRARQAQEQLRRELGEQLTPILTQGYEAVANLLTGFSEMPGATQAGITGLSGASVAATAAASAFGLLRLALLPLFTVPAGLIIAGAAAAVGLGVALHRLSTDTEDLEQVERDLTTALQEQQTEYDRTRAAVNNLLEATDEDGLRGAIETLASTLDEEGRASLKRFAEETAFPLAAQGKFQEAIRATLDLLAQQRRVALSTTLESYMGSADQAQEQVNRLTQQLEAAEELLERLEAGTAGNPFNNEAAIARQRAGIEGLKTQLRSASGVYQLYAEGAREANTELRALHDAEHEFQSGLIDSNRYVAELGEILGFSAGELLEYNNAQETAAGGTKDTAEAIEKVGKETRKTAREIKTVEDVLADLGDKLEDAERQGAALGEQFDVTATQANAVKNAINTLVTEFNLDPASEQVQALIDLLAQLESQLASPTRDAEIWTTRLADELSSGLKSAQEVYDLLLPTVERLKDELKTLHEEGRYGSDAWNVAAAKLEAIEALFNRVRDSARDVLPKITTDVVDPVRVPKPGVTAEVDSRVVGYHQAILRMAEEERRAWDAVNEVRYGSNDAQLALTLQSVEQAEGRFTDLNDALNKLGNTGVTVTAPMLDLLKTRFREVEEQAKGAAEMSRRLFEIAEGQRAEDPAAAIKRTIQAVEQSAGVFTSFADGFRKMRDAGVKLDKEVLQVLRDRFGEARRATDEFTDSLIRNSAMARNVTISTPRDITHPGASVDIKGTAELTRELRDELAPALQLVTAETSLFGTEQERLGQQAEATRRYIVSLLEQGFEPTSPAIQNLVSDYEALRAQQAQLANNSLETMFGQLQTQVTAVTGSLRELSPAAADTFNVLVGGGLDLAQAITGVTSLGDAFNALAERTSAAENQIVSSVGGMISAIGQMATGNIIGGVGSIITSIVGAITKISQRAEEAARRVREEVAEAFNLLNSGGTSRRERQVQNELREAELRRQRGEISERDFLREQRRLEIRQANAQQSEALGALGTRRQQALQGIDPNSSLYAQLVRQFDAERDTIIKSFDLARQEADQRFRKGMQDIAQREIDEATRRGRRQRPRPQEREKPPKQRQQEAKAAAGSIAALEEKLAVARKQFEEAATDNQRRQAAERIRILEAEIAERRALLNEFKEDTGPKEAKKVRIEGAIAIDEDIFATKINEFVRAITDYFVPAVNQFTGGAKSQSFAPPKMAPSPIRTLSTTPIRYPEVRMPDLAMPADLMMDAALINRDAAGRMDRATQRFDNAVGRGFGALTTRGYR